MANVRILLAKNMKHFRKIYGFTQMELAEKIGCSPTLIGKIETMKRFPSAENIDRISEILKITPAELFTDFCNQEVMKIKENIHKHKKNLEKMVLKAIDEAY